MGFIQFDLDPRVMAGIREAGYSEPTPIQKAAMPFVLQGRDVLGLAQTGTGKTAAFLLPILDRLIRGPRRCVRALVIAPTRELAEQTFKASVQLGFRTGIRSTAVYGGVSKRTQLAEIERGAEIVIACPGRLLDHIDDRKIDLSNVEVLVLDEADRMCDMGFLPDIRRIIAKLPRSRQNLFFSATMPDDIRHLADSLLENPETVQIGMIAPAKTVSHALYPIRAEEKKNLLFRLLEQTPSSRVLIFTRTKHRARSLALSLAKEGYRVAALQGNMSQNARQQSISGFRKGKYDFLVATDIAARGIDVSEISHVINFDMPDTVDAYIHRIGRTGRVDKSGEAFTLVAENDADMVRQIEKVLDTRIERRRLKDFDYNGFRPESQIAKPRHLNWSKNQSRNRVYRSPGSSRKPGTLSTSYSI